MATNNGMYAPTSTAFFACSSALGAGGVPWTGAPGEPPRPTAGPPAHAGGSRRRVGKRHAIDDPSATSLYERTEREHCEHRQAMTTADWFRQALRRRSASAHRSRSATKQLVAIGCQQLARESRSAPDQTAPVPHTTLPTCRVGHCARAGHSQRSSTSHADQPGVFRQLSESEAVHVAILYWQGGS